MNYELVGPKDPECQYIKSLLKEHAALLESVIPEDVRIRGIDNYIDNQIICGKTIEVIGVELPDMRAISRGVSNNYDNIFFAVDGSATPTVMSGSLNFPLNEGIYFSGRCDGNHGEGWLNALVGNAYFIEIDTGGNTKKMVSDTLVSNAIPRINMLLEKKNEVLSLTGLHSLCGSAGIEIVIGDKRYAI